MKDEGKRKFLFLILSFITFGFGVILYGKLALRNGEIDKIIMPGIIAVTVTVLSVSLAYQQYLNIKKGLPIEDEMSKQILTKAAANSFYMSLYWLLAVNMLDLFSSEIFRPDGNSLMINVLGMFVIFTCNWLWLNFKGKVK